MHRTEGIGHINNMFVDGPPGTRVEQEWLNSVQEEIAYVIEQCGGTLLTASTDTRDQLWDALLTAGIRFDSGSTAFFYNSTAPVGWTKKLGLQENSMLIYTTGVIGYGGFYDAHLGHPHGISILSGDDSGSDRDQGSGSNTCARSPHKHYLSGNVLANTAPRYVMLLAATKD